MHVDFGGTRVLHLFHVLHDATTNPISGGEGDLRKKCSEK